MSVALIQQLDEITNYRNEEIPTIMGKALELGVRRLWEETMLEAYFKNKITREEVVNQVGLDLVRIGEEQRDAAKEDVRWGLYGK